MKKLFTLGLVAFTSFAFASSLECAEGSEVTVYIDDQQFEGVVHLEIENVSSNALDVHCARNVTEDIDGGQNYFCWTQCYLPGADLSPTPSTIPANSSVDLFSAHVKPQGNQGVFRATYTFFDANNPTDKVDVMVNVYSTPVGIVAHNFENEISLISPNPANEYTIVTYSANQDKNSKLVIYNMLGAKIEEVELLEENGVVKVDTYKMKAGVYFVNLVSDDKIMSTQKLVVTK